MAGTKEIRTKIKSVQNTRKITKAMEMVAASKMRKAQERMRAARPYAEKIRNVAAHMALANPEYKPPHRPLSVVTTIRPARLMSRATMNGCVETQTTAIGTKGMQFLGRVGAKVVSNVVHLGDTPHLEKLIGAIKVQLDAFNAGQIDAVYLAYTRFINTMKQEPVVEQLLPLTADKLAQSDAEKQAYSWDYIYEPDAQTVVDELLIRYVEALVYQAVAENMASEQSARMVAMKAASDNAKNVIGELQLVYNKTRQAAITKELSEIVSGAAAV